MGESLRKLPVKRPGVLSFVGFGASAPTSFLVIGWPLAPLASEFIHLYFWQWARYGFLRQSYVIIRRAHFYTWSCMCENHPGCLSIRDGSRRCGSGWRACVQLQCLQQSKQRPVRIDYNYKSYKEHDRFKRQIAHEVFHRPITQAKEEQIPGGLVG